MTANVLIGAQTINVNNYGTNTVAISVQVPSEYINVSSVVANGQIFTSNVSGLLANVTAVNFVTAPNTSTNTYVLSFTPSSGGPTFNIYVPFYGYGSNPFIPSLSYMKLGINLGSLQYYCSIQPFLNIFHNSGNQPQYSGWACSPNNPIADSSGNYDAAYDLPLDANGYCTTMNGFSGTVYTNIYTSFGVNYTSPVLSNNTVFATQTNGLAPGAAYYYPPGSYTLTVTGNGTCYMSGDAVAQTGQSNGAGYTISKLTLTVTDNGTHSMLFNVNSPSTVGLTFNISALGPNGYISNVSVVPTQYLSLYQAGQIYHPMYLQACYGPNANGPGQGYSRIRGMEWTNVDTGTYPSTYFGADSTNNKVQIIMATNAGGNYFAKKVNQIGGNTAEIVYQGGSNVATSTANGYAQSWSTSTANCILIQNVQGTFTTTGNIIGVTSGATNAVKQVLPNMIVGSTFGILSANVYPNGWSYPSGNYAGVMSSGQAITFNCTYGNANVKFNTALTAVPPMIDSFLNNWIPYIASWNVVPGILNSGRASPNSLCWSTTKGVPYEAMINLANSLNADYWVNIPLLVGTNCFVDGANTYTNACATLIKNTLNSNVKAYIELSNEVWNSPLGYSYNCARLLSIPQFGANTGGESQFYAQQVAYMAYNFYQTFGATAYYQRVRASMGAQTAPGNGPYYLDYEMRTPNWYDANGVQQTAYHFGGGGSNTVANLIQTVHFAPYMPNGANDTNTPISSADINTMLATSDPVTTFFNLHYTNTYGGNTYSSVFANGWLIQCILNFQDIVNVCKGYSWWNAANVSVTTYEGGSYWVPSAIYNNQNWFNLIFLAHRDIRLGYVHFDPANKMCNTYGITQANGFTGYIPELYATTGLDCLTIHSDIGPISYQNDGYIIENPLQVVNVAANGMVMGPIPIANTPARYQGCMNFIANTSW